MTTPPRILVHRTYDRQDDLEAEWSLHYNTVLERTQGQNEAQSIASLLNSASSPESKQNLVLGLMFGILYDKTSSLRYFKAIGAITNEQYSACVSPLKSFVLEKLVKALDSTFEQCLWLCSSLISLKVQESEKLLASLIRNILTGSTASKNLHLVQTVLDICTNYRDWLYDNPSIIPCVVYTFASIIPDHHRLDTLREREVNLVALLLREKFEICKSIGRDLVRVVYNISLIPAIKKVWDDVFMEQVAPQTPQLKVLYSTPSPKDILTSRITPEMETWLKFIMQNVKKGNQMRYQAWFATKYLCQAEHEMLVPELIRWIVGVHHPPNHILSSDIVPRYKILGWLISILKTPHIIQNAKQALFYDWYFYSPTKDNLMNLEPAAILISRSVAQQVQFVTPLAEYLVTAADNYLFQVYQPVREDIRKGLLAASSTMIERKVVPNFDELLNCNQIAQPLRDALRKLLAGKHSSHSHPHPQPPQQPSTSNLTSLTSIGSTPHLPPASSSNAFAAATGQKSTPSTTATTQSQSQPAPAPSPKQINAIQSPSTSTNTPSQIATPTSKGSVDLSGNGSSLPAAAPAAVSVVSNSSSSSIQLPPSSNSSSMDDDDAMWSGWTASVASNSSTASTSTSTSSNAAGSSSSSVSSSSMDVDGTLVEVGAKTNFPKQFHSQFLSLRDALIDTSPNSTTSTTKSLSSTSAARGVAVAAMTTLLGDAVTIAEFEASLTHQIADSLITLLQQELLDSLKPITCDSHPALDTSLPLCHYVIFDSIFSLFSKKNTLDSDEKRCMENLFSLLIALKSIDSTFGWRFVVWLISSKVGNSRSALFPSSSLSSPQIESEQNSNLQSLLNSVQNQTQLELKAEGVLKCPQWVDPYKYLLQKLQGTITHNNSSLNGNETSPGGGNSGNPELSPLFLQDMQTFTQSNLDLFNHLLPQICRYFADFALGNTKFMKLALENCYPSTGFALICNIANSSLEFIGDQLSPTLANSLWWDSYSQQVLWNLVKIEFQSHTDMLEESIISILPDLHPSKSPEALSGVLVCCTHLVPTKLLLEALLSTSVDLNQTVVSILNGWADQPDDELEHFIKIVGQTLTTMSKKSQKKQLVRNAMSHFALWQAVPTSTFSELINASSKLKKQIQTLINSHCNDEVFISLFKACDESEKDNASQEDSPPPDRETKSSRGKRSHPEPSEDEELDVKNAPPPPKRRRAE